VYIQYQKEHILELLLWRNLQELVARIKWKKEFLSNSFLSLLFSFRLIN
jgi:hypothetical protein